MSNPQRGPKRLPERPSEENLKKQAKRRAKRDGIALSTAQHRVAREYGFASWAKLVAHVREGGETGQEFGNDRAAIEGIVEAASLADVEGLTRGMAAGIPVDVRDDKGNPLLVLVCKSTESAEKRVAAAKALIDAGAPVRAWGEEGAHALHWAARFGPVELVELLIRSGGLTWQGDDQERDTLAYARDGVAPDKERLVEMLDRPVMRDANFRAAVRAIQSGDLTGLRKLLKAHPKLIHDRAVEPDCYPKDYFRDPKLVWFVADNPNLIATMPGNTMEIAEALIDAGAEREDLEYTLALVMTSGAARKQGFQRPLIKLLISRGARVGDGSFVSALGHGELDAVEAAVEMGVPVSVTVAAATGRLDDLARLLKTASAEQKHAALSVAVINRKLEAARMCLGAGADVNAYSEVHRHSMPIHQAAGNGDVEMLKLLVARGARLDVRDTLWNGTPLGWAIHSKQAEGEAYLRGLGNG